MCIGWRENKETLELRQFWVTGLFVKGLLYGYEKGPRPQGGEKKDASELRGCKVNGMFVCYDCFMGVCEMQSICI